MTEPPVQDEIRTPSAGSVIGAMLLGGLGILFLLSTGCFEVFGIMFLADGQSSALLLVLFGIGMGFLTYVTFLGAKRMLSGPKPELAPNVVPIASEAPAADRPDEPGV